MAQMTMDPPTDFAIEPRSVKLRPEKYVPLGGTRTNGTPVQVSVYRTLEALYSICRKCKVEVFVLQ